MDEKNCGVCIHSDLETGRFCNHPLLRINPEFDGPRIDVARSASASPCGPGARLYEPCKCTEPFCPRHGQDKRR